MEIVTISWKNAVFDLKCFINLGKYEQVITDNLVNFK